MLRPFNYNSDSSIRLHPTSSTRCTTELRSPLMHRHRRKSTRRHARLTFPTDRHSRRRSRPKVRTAINKRRRRPRSTTLRSVHRVHRYPKLRLLCRRLSIPVRRYPSNVRQDHSHATSIKITPRRRAGRHSKTPLPTRPTFTQCYHANGQQGTPTLQKSSTK